MAGAYETGVYRNIFKECGYSEEEIEKRVKETFETIFYGSEEERFYHEAGADMGYMEDTGNHDVRTCLLYTSQFRDRMRRIWSINLFWKKAEHMKQNSICSHPIRLPERINFFMRSG